MKSEPTTASYFKAWLLFIVCSVPAGMLVGAVAGGVIGAFIGIACATTGHTEMISVIVRPVGGVVGFIAATISSFFFYRFSTAKLVAKVLQAKDLNS